MVTMQKGVSHPPTPSLLSTREAITYLQQRHPTIAVTYDMFSHRVIRGAVPHHREKNLGATRWYFDRATLDSISFRTSSKQQSLPERLQAIAKSKGVDLPLYGEPVLVSTTEDLNELTQKYGTLVDDNGLLRLLEERTHHTYTLGAIKARRLRNTIVYVGYSGGQHRRYWYPVSQLDFLRLQPQPRKAS